MNGFINQNTIKTEKNLRNLPENHIDLSPRPYDKNNLPCLNKLQNQNSFKSYGHNTLSSTI